MLANAGFSGSYWAGFMVGLLVGAAIVLALTHPLAPWMRRDDECDEATGFHDDGSGGGLDRES